jgi:Ca2+-transporting ATPase
LGATTVLCVDKTGTLTENRMAVAELATDTEHHHAGDPNLAAAIAATIHVAALACPRDPVDPMEKAILAFAATDAPESMRMRKTWQLVREYSLTRELLAVTGCWQSPDDGSIVVASKGAPEAIADLCAFDAERRRRILAATAEMAARGRRVLGVAHCVWSELALPGNPRGFRFEFVGLIGLADPIRPGVAKAVRECAQAGIRVVMITGDYPGTARAIAAEIGLQSSGGVLTGAELASLGSTELRDRIADVNVFARVLPEQKLTLVDALKARGEVVAMTGDGVNDAPALKAAHIGIAMGGRGTDVAREAASLVLLEDDFDSIVEAVRLGRRIYDNIRHALAYLIAVHVPIAGMATLPLLLGWPPVFSPVHIVFLEFIIDPACSFAFEAEPENPGTMKRPPRPPNEPLLGMSLLAQSFVQGAIMLGATAVLYAYALHSFADVEHARAIAFAALVMGNMMLILGNRSQTRGILETLRMPNPALWWTLGGACLGLAAAVYVPWFRQLFGFSLLGPMDILACFATAALGALCGEVIRLRRSESRTRR